MTAVKTTPSKTFSVFTASTTRETLLFEEPWGDQVTTFRAELRSTLEEEIAVLNGLKNRFTPCSMVGQSVSERKNPLPVQP